MQQTPISQNPKFKITKGAITHIVGRWLIAHSGHCQGLNQQTRSPFILRPPLCGTQGRYYKVGRPASWPLVSKAANLSLRI